jgi:hypothetical protein
MECSALHRKQAVDGKNPAVRTREVRKALALMTHFLQIHAA